MKLAPFNWLALSFFGYYCAYGVFMPFFPAWLKSQAYNEEIIGFILASSYVFRFLGGVGFSAMIKKAGHLIKALRGLAWASCGAMLYISLVAENFPLLCVGIAIFAMLNAAGMPIGDTLANTWQQQIHLDYGKARLIGSGAFVVGVSLFGSLIGFIGENYIVAILTALLGFYALIQMITPSVMPQDSPQSAVENHISFSQLLKNKTTLRLILAISLIHGSHAAYYAYSVLYWQSLGISVPTTSLLWGLSVVAEILLFFFSTKLFRFWKVSTLFYCGASAAVLRWAVLGSTDSLTIIALTQLLHSLTFALGHYAMVRYITTQPQNHIAKLQGLYNGISSSAVIALITAFAGVLYPISPQLTFTSMMIFALLAFPIIPRKVDAFLVRRVESVK
ncbi:3-phenylpropionate MFS transporter [Avibacterium paragallinarum]|uniref:3-phenylpropionate MFS transporter n=1 Tax=Avibacterium paragallinarum TaxID=728 RepID=A0AAE5TJ34_AVIPA|nr:3-phenylpropionate MFS transporter [Avibacterium paragallinarum]MEE3607909.1 3-phenylpropionate MFS transporter [Avibacterium paragallinarum]MEE3620336.1 3-phenylpropionate MFS transporter [Avibacterium paragallinarum]MEE3668174.1 3-phenylpropionate MFS transporter [Avibacterium paragallinarum]MEE3679753.1 3-phenylpropionate MFS transporter [Avibacterium paragallinarum]MEE4385097.1 3-phenylpropionate MFS transporter [Avibacterium paragallinarum]